MEVLTIGHSDQPFERFLEALEANGVGLVADVRTVPRSRRVPWSAGEALAPALAERGIGYVHLKALGGLRKPVAGATANAAWRNASFRGYADHMQTPAFAEGLARLLALARERRVAIMCAEAVPWRCHRGLVADALVARGVRVGHVLSPTKTDPHRLTPHARVDGERVTYPAAVQATLEGGEAAPAKRKTRRARKATKASAKRGSGTESKKAARGKERNTTRES